MSLPLPSVAPPGASDSLFERFAWVYAFFRNHVFRDDTDGITAALWPKGGPPAGSRLLELGCGPGFYCCRFAERFRQLRVIGIDRSPQQLRRARRSAKSRRLENCRFEQSDALALDLPSESVDALLAVRLFTIVAERERALAEMHRVLRPGGRCFIAEPCSRRRALVPLRVMWLLANLIAFFGVNDAWVYREPPEAVVLAPDTFGELVSSQPWRSIWRWQDVHYQYSLCEKAGPEGPSIREITDLAEEDFAI